MKKEAAHPPKQGTINSCKGTTSERPLILDQIVCEIMFAVNERSYLSIIWDCWITVLEIRKADNPFIFVREAALVRYKSTENTHQLCANYNLTLDAF